MGNAAGLGAFGFWIFLAAVVVGGIWFDARRRESLQETLRRVVESGQQLDQEVLDRLLAEGGSQSLERDLRVGGLIVVFIAPGLAIMSWFLGRLSVEAMYAVLGASFLTAFVGAGLLFAARLIRQRDESDKP